MNFAVKLISSVMNATETQQTEALEKVKQYSELAGLATIITGVFLAIIGLSCLGSGSIFWGLSFLALAGLSSTCSRDSFKIRDTSTDLLSKKFGERLKLLFKEQTEKTPEAFWDKITEKTYLLKYLKFVILN